MRILIYGAGVIGSLYAVLFAETGYDTSIYARGKRLEFLKKNGLLYKKSQNIRRAEATILGELSDNDAYDFILLTVRGNQLYEALAELKNNKSNTIVTMVNSLDSYKKWEDIVGKGRILPAFPGAGGSINNDGILDAALTPRMIQPTTFAEISGNKSEKTLDSYKKWEDIVGTGRILPAFSGAGGSINDDGILDAALWITKQSVYNQFYSDLVTKVQHAA